MVLFRAIEMKRSIQEFREELHCLALKNGISHPDVLILSKKLDEKINSMQHLLIQLPKDPIPCSLSEF